MNYKSDYRVLLSGEFACFTRPEFSGERESYDFITPSAARNILQNIYWQKGFDYVIDRIHVLEEIKKINWRTNEVKVKTSSDQTFKAINGTAQSPWIDAKEERVQRNSRILTNPKYLIEFHIRMWKNHKDFHIYEDKIHGILMKRLRKNQSYRTLYFGMKDFPCWAALAPKDDPEGFYANSPAKDFGKVFFDRDYKTGEAYFFCACMKNGIIDLRNAKIC